MMRYSAILIAACSVLLFSMVACTSSPANSSTKIDSEKELEAIYGFEVAANKLTFLVESNNCTDAKHFELKTELVREPTTETKVYILSLVRNKPDRCRAMPGIVEISIPLNDSLTDGSTLEFKNPIRVNSQLRRVQKAGTRTGS